MILQVLENYGHPDDHSEGYDLAIFRADDGVDSSYCLKALHDDNWAKWIGDDFKGLSGGEAFFYRPTGHLNGEKWIDKNGDYIDQGNGGVKYKLKDSNSVYYFSYSTDHNVGQGFYAGSEGYSPVIDKAEKIYARENAFKGEEIEPVSILEFEVSRYSKALGEFDFHPIGILNYHEEYTQSTEVAVVSAAKVNDDVEPGFLVNTDISGEVFFSGKDLTEAKPLIERFLTRNADDYVERNLINIDDSLLNGVELDRKSKVKPELKLADLKVSFAQHTSSLRIEPLMLELAYFEDGHWSAASETGLNKTFDALAKDYVENHFGAKEHLIKNLEGLLPLLEPSLCKEISHGEDTIKSPIAVGDFLASIGGLDSALSSGYIHNHVDGDDLDILAGALGFETWCDILEQTKNLYGIDVEHFVDEHRISLLNSYVQLYKSATEEKQTKALAR